MLPRSFEWCDRLWNGSRMVVSGNTAPLSSRANISVDTRVMSDWNASTCRSISSLRCSANVGRHAGRHVGQRHVLARRRLGALNAALDLAHVLEILIEPPAIARRQVALQRRQLRHHRIEQAPRVLPPAAALGRGGAVAEQLLEHQPRVVLHRQRLRRRLPRNRVAIGAAEARLAREHRLLDRQLQRRQRRVLADVLRRHLIGRDAQVRLRARAAAPSR